VPGRRGAEVEPALGNSDCRASEEPLRPVQALAGQPEDDVAGPDRGAVDVGLR